jgi:hypothetical protein
MSCRPQDRPARELPAVRRHTDSRPENGLPAGLLGPPELSEKVIRDAPRNQNAKSRHPGRATAVSVTLRLSPPRAVAMSRSMRPTRHEQRAMTNHSIEKSSRPLAELALIKIIARDVAVLAERQALEDAISRDEARAKMSARAKEREARRKLQRAAVPPVSITRRMKHG